MKKVGIVSAVLTLLMVVVLGGCSSINAPSARQLMSIGSTAPIAQVEILVDLVAKSTATPEEKTTSNSELWLNESKRMISIHHDMMQTHHQNILREREALAEKNRASEVITEVTTEVATEEKIADRYISYDEMITHHQEMHDGTGGYYCYNHGLYTDSDRFESSYNSNNSYGGHHRGSYNNSRRGGYCH